MHRTTPAIRAPYMSKYGRTRPRCTCTAAAHAPANSAAGTAASHPAADRSMAAWGRIAPQLAVAAAPLSSPSEAPSSPPQLPQPPSCLALRLPCSPPPHRHLRESNPRLYTRPAPLPAATAWPDAGRERRAGRRARRVGGGPKRRLVALARRRRGGWLGTPLQTLESTILRQGRPTEVEVKGGRDDKQGWEDWGRGTARAYGTAHLRNEPSSRPIMCDEQIGERTAKKESKGDRQIGSWS